MSEIILNRHGIDQLGFEITTEGDSVASCTLNTDTPIPFGAYRTTFER